MANDVSILLRNIIVSQELIGMLNFAWCSIVRGQKRICSRSLTTVVHKGNLIFLFEELLQTIIEWIPYSVFIYHICIIPTIRHFVWQFDNLSASCKDEPTRTPIGPKDRSSRCMCEARTTYILDIISPNIP